MRINILAAICSAVSAGMWFLITERVLVSWFPQRWQRILGGVLAALIGATAFTVWNQSVVNEKVYTVSLVGIAIISWLMIRWSDDPDGPKADRILVLVAYLCGLGYANHMAGMLAAPAVGLAVLIVRPRTIFRWKLLLACVGMLLVRAHAVRDAADSRRVLPGDQRRRADRVPHEARAVVHVLEGHVRRVQLQLQSRPVRQARALRSSGVASASSSGCTGCTSSGSGSATRTATTRSPQALFAAAFLVLGLFGGWVHFQRDRRSFWYFGSLMFTMTLVLIYYLNFKLGASQDPNSQAPHEVRDRDYFFLWSFSAWGVWAALGLLFVWESIAALFGTETVKVGRETSTRCRRSTRGVLTSPVLLLADRAAVRELALGVARRAS